MIAHFPRWCTQLASAVALLLVAMPLAAADRFGGVEGLPRAPGSEADRHLRSQQAEFYANLPWAIRNAEESGPLAWRAANHSALGQPEWEIKHQDITVDLNANKSSVALQITATVLNHLPVEQLSFVTSKLDTVKVSIGDVPQQVQVQSMGDYSLLTLDLAAPLTPETSLEVHVEGAAKIDCSPLGIGLRPCGVGANYQWLTFWRYYLLPALNVHNPFTSELHVITAGEKVAGAPGLPDSVSVLPDGRKMYTFKQLERTDNAGFGIAAYQPIQTKLDTGVNLNVYVTKNFAKGIQPFVAEVQKIVAWYGARFGAFPWPVLNLIQLENDFGGGYAPLSGVFMLRDTFGAQPESNGWDGSIELTAHELGHQWWGNLVEPLTAGDVSVSESLAEYSSCFYTETTLQTRGQILRNHLSYLYTVSATDDTPVGAQNVYNSAAYVQIIYHKGSIVFDMLRRLVGDEVAHQALKLYATKFNRDFARVDDVRAAFEEASGQKLDWFFQQWFGRKSHIKAELTGRIVADDSGKWTLRLRINQLTDKLFRFTTNVTIDYPGGKSEVVPVEINPANNADGGTATVVSLPLTQRPVRVRVDAQRFLLRKFATGTPGDFNLSGLVDGADLVELAVRHGRAINVTGKNGQKYYFPDTSWNELYDLQPDGRVSDDDVTALDQWVGLEAEEF